MTTAGEMRERVGVLSLVYDREADEYRWAEVRRVWARAVRMARVVTSPPFLAKNAQSAEATVSTKSSAKSIILVEGIVTQSSSCRWALPVRFMK